MKNYVTNFDLEEAFKALDALDYEASQPKLIGRNRNLAEGYKCSAGKLTTEVLLEDYYDLEDKNDVEQATQARADDIAQAKLARIEKIIDLDAKSPDELLPSYVGKIIVQCPQCMNLFYKNKEDIEVDDNDPTICNVNEPCQHCGNNSGYTIIGKVGTADEEPAESEEAEEPVKDNAEEVENEVEVSDETAEDEAAEDEEASEEDNELVKPEESEEDSEEELSDEELADLDLNLESFGIVDGTPLREDISEDEIEMDPAEEDLSESVESVLAAFESSLGADEPLSEDLEDEEVSETKKVINPIVTNAEFKKMINSRVFKDFAEGVKPNHVSESVETTLAAFSQSLEETLATLKKNDKLDEAVAITIGVDEIDDKVVANSPCDCMIVSKPEATKVYMQPEVLGSLEDHSEVAQEAVAEPVKPEVEAEVADMVVDAVEPDLASIELDSESETEEEYLTEGVLDLIKRKVGDIGAALKRNDIKLSGLSLNHAIKDLKVGLAGTAGKKANSFGDALKQAEQLSKLPENKDRLITVSGSSEKGDKFDTIVVYENGKVFQDNVQSVIQQIKARTTTGAQAPQQEEKPAEEKPADTSAKSGVEKLKDKINAKVTTLWQTTWDALIKSENAALAEASFDLHADIQDPDTTLEELKQSVERFAQAKKIYDNLQKQPKEKPAEEKPADTSAKSGVAQAAEAGSETTNQKASTGSKHRASTSDKFSAAFNNFVERQGSSGVELARKIISGTGTISDWQELLNKVGVANKRQPKMKVDKAGNVKIESLANSDLIETQACLAESLKSDLAEDLKVELTNLQEAISKELVSRASLDLAKVTDCDDDSINSCISEALKKVYTNVSSFEATNCALTNGKLMIEGLITFESGKSRHTAYQFNQASYTNDQLILHGMNEAFGRDSQFDLTCKLESLDNEVHLLVEGLSYKYSVSNTIVEGLVKYNK